MAFSGTFDYTLDAKNRLTVPARFRASLSESVVLAKSAEPCLTIWPRPDFEAYVASGLEGLHPFSPDRDKVKRFFFSNSFDTELDAAGRVMVPKDLMQYAGLAKDVVVNGVQDRIEVWDRAAWATYNAALDIQGLTAMITGQGAPA